MFSERDQFWMQRALELAQQAVVAGEVPVGAIIVLNNEIIGEGSNSPIKHHDPTAHAEIIAMRDAAQHIENYRLVDATLYVTLEPCLMCAGAMVHARIARLVYGATDAKAGAVQSQCQVLNFPYLNHRVTVSGGLLADQCGELLTQFFKARRN
jgi:tRNA(adenine34) deaminase